jgi:hypothetical protein
VTGRAGELLGAVQNAFDAGSHAPILHGGFHLFETLTKGKVSLSKKKPHWAIVFKEPRSVGVVTDFWVARPEALRRAWRRKDHALRSSGRATFAVCASDLISMAGVSCQRPRWGLEFHRNHASWNIQQFLSIPFNPSRLRKEDYPLENLGLPGGED